MKDEALIIVAGLCADGVLDKKEEAILRKALAQPEQEPVAYLYHDANSLEELLDAERKCLNMHSVLISIRRHEAYRNETPLYTTTPQRKPMTEENLRHLAGKHLYYHPEDYVVSGVFERAKTIEALLKEKNT